MPSSRPARVGIAGLGLIGASFALALRRARPEIRITGHDGDGAVLERALERQVVDQAAASLDELGECDVILLAVPIGAMRATLAGLPRGPVVTDVASTKARVVRWAAEAGVPLVGGHPMAGREGSGLDAAEADLFQGAAWVLTSPSPEVEELVRAVGAEPVFLEPEEHDELVAGISHAAFALSAAYMLAAAASPQWREMSRLAASGFRDLTRLASGSPEMYASIAETNPARLAAWVWQVEQQLARIRRHLEQGDARLVELFEEARAARERWLKERSSG